MVSTELSTAGSRKGATGWQCAKKLARAEGASQLINEGEKNMPAAQTYMLNSTSGSFGPSRPRSILSAASGRAGPGRELSPSSIRDGARASDPSDRSELTNSQESAPVPAPESVPAPVPTSSGTLPSIAGSSITAKPDVSPASLSNRASLARMDGSGPPRCAGWISATPKPTPSVCGASSTLKESLSYSKEQRICALTHRSHGIWRGPAHFCFLSGQHTGRPHSAGARGPFGEGADRRAAYLLRH